MHGVLFPMLRNASAVPWRPGSRETPARAPPT
jgi:hypothetical protein